MTSRGPRQTARQRVLKLLASATHDELHIACAEFSDSTSAVDLKPAEIGLVMVRGRVGGDGAPFNVGEATVVRAIVQLPDGAVGFGMRLGRDRKATRAAAILDGLWQSPAYREAVETGVLHRIQTRLANARAVKRAEVAATRVNFFTLAREAT